MITFIFLAPTLDFVSSVFYVNESDGTVDNVVCMTVTPPKGGLECDVEVPLYLVDGKAGGLSNNDYYNNDIIQILYTRAEAGLDFAPNSDLSIVFQATTYNTTIEECATIEIIDDINVECSHSFFVEVKDIDCDVFPPITSATTYAEVIIKDNDGMLSLHIQTF